MLKKFFVAVIVALLVASVQIAAAEDFDWSKAPRFGTKAELARYIESERRKGNTTFRVVFTNELKTSKEEFDNEFSDNELAIEKFANLTPVPHVSVEATHFTDGTAQVTYQITEYPGTRVANTYLSPNKHQAWMNLTNEEQKLYTVAVGIVDEAKKYSSARDKARHIHNAIHERVKDWQIIDGATAVDALIYGKTDCEGFMDSFYMLGRMAGLNVDRIRGTINNGKTSHVWNTITLEDGRTYCVDVSQDWINLKNGSDKYKYFIVPSTTMKNNSYWCEWSIIPNLQ